MVPSEEEGASVDHFGLESTSVFPPSSPPVSRLHGIEEDHLGSSGGERRERFQSVSSLECKKQGPRGRKEDEAATIENSASRFSASE